MRSRTCLWAIAAMTICLLTLASGCDLTLGPKVKTTYTLIHPGRPMEVVEAVKAKGRLLDGTGDAVTQDIGGWVVMPPDHWELVQRKLRQLEKTSTP